MKYLTVKQVSEKLGISTQWIYDLIKTKKLRAEKAGAIWLIREKDISEKKV